MGNRSALPYLSYLTFIVCLEARVSYIVTVKYLSHDVSAFRRLIGAWRDPATSPVPYSPVLGVTDKVGTVEYLSVARVLF